MSEHMDKEAAIVAALDQNGITFFNNEVKAGLAHELADGDVTLDLTAIRRAATAWRVITTARAELIAGYEAHRPESAASYAAEYIPALKLVEHTAMFDPAKGNAHILYVLSHIVGFLSLDRAVAEKRNMLIVGSGGATGGDAALS